MNPDTRLFLETLFENVPENLYGMLWSLADKRTHWFPLGRGTDTVAADASKLSLSSDLYVAVSVAQEAGGPHRRISSENSAGVMGLWADVDIADHDVHKKWNLPPDEVSARALLQAAGLPPTLLVHSGHGLQAWWLFKEFWEFTGSQDRVEAGMLAQRWNTTLRLRAAERDWTVDSTFDLARVMRVPGTMNRKGEPVQPVRLLEVSPLRYDPGDFEEYCVDDKFLEDMGLSATRTYVVSGELVLRADATPPFDKYEALRANDTKFAESLDRRRRDLRDQTASSYDMSLVSLAARAGWCVDTETEIFTRRGWLRWNEVTPGDETLAVEEVSGIADWQTVEDVVVFDDGAARELYEFSSNNFSAVTTRDHRWLSSKERWQKEKLVRWVTSENFTSQDRVPRAAPTVRPTRKTVTDSMVELVAWTYTEGTIRRGVNPSIHVYQSSSRNFSNCERIRGALKSEFGDRWGESSGGGPMRVFSIGVARAPLVLQHVNSDKSPTVDFLDRLTQPQLDLFLEVAILGDGHSRLTSTNSLRRSDFFFQNVGPRLDAFLTACALAGRPASYRLREGAGNHFGTRSLATVCLYNSERFAKPRAHGELPRKFLSTEPVWCPVVPEGGNWLARRRGTIYYTGNSDQEIADLVIYSRRRHGDDLDKALRPDYQARTIAKARNAMASDEASEVMDEVIDTYQEARRSGDDEEAKQRHRAALGTLSAQMGLEILQFIRFTSDPPTFRMVTPLQGINLGQAGGILSWTAFRESVYAQARHQIPRFKQEAWDRITQAVISLCEDQDVGLESTEVGEMDVWIAEYLSARPPIEDPEQARVMEHPFQNAAGVHVFGTAFKRWLWLNHGEKKSNKDLGRMLRLYGASPFKQNVSDDDGRRSSRSAWTLPADVVDR